MSQAEIQPETPIDPRREADWDDLCNDPAMLRHLVDSAASGGNLGALIALACQHGLTGDPALDEIPDGVNHPGAVAAVHAYAAWARAEGRDLPIEIHDPADDPVPEVVPLALQGKWIGWSQDGLRILASADTTEEVIRLATEAGEPEPILYYHPKGFGGWRR